jgi:hypothetical protein
LTIIAFPDCSLCDGSGLVIGGDEYQQCPDCRLRARRNGAADALAIGAALLRTTWDGRCPACGWDKAETGGRHADWCPRSADVDQQQSAVNAEPGWEKYEGLSPLEARYADGDR